MGKKVQFAALKLKERLIGTGAEQMPGTMKTIRETKMRIAKYLSFAFMASTLILASPPSWAKAYFPSAKEMIQKADFIALVQLDATTAQEAKGTTWTYGEVSNSHLKKTIKGNLPANFKIYGREDFKCAQCHFLEGENLVFLRKDLDLYVGQAWNISCLPVKDGKVTWFSNLNLNRSDAQTKLDDCIKQIKDTLKN